MRCECGSGLESRVLSDGHGIYLCKACDECEEKKLAGFREDIMEAYHTDEPIDDIELGTCGICGERHCICGEPMDAEELMEHGFADPGGNSALRAATKSNPRNLPCPTCGEPNRLTPADKQLGYQCDACADTLEMGGP